MGWAAWEWGGERLKDVGLWPTPAQTGAKLFSQSQVPFKWCYSRLLVLWCEGGREGAGGAAGAVIPT